MRIFILLSLLIPSLCFSANFETQVKKTEELLNKASATNHIIMHLSDLVHLYEVEIKKKSPNKEQYEKWLKSRDSKYKGILSKYPKAKYGSSRSVLISEEKLKLLKTKYNQFK